MPSFPSPPSPTRFLRRADFYPQAKVPSRKQLQPTGSAEEWVQCPPETEETEPAEEKATPQVTRRETGSGTEPGQAGQPPLLPAVAVAGRLHLLPPFRGSGLPAAASASRTARALHRDLAGGGTGSTSARPSEPRGLAARPALPFSRRPRGPAWRPVRGDSASAQPTRPAHLSTTSQARRAGTQNHARPAAAPSRAGLHSRTGSRRRDRK